jgi:CheY-like chemotaxis protein
MTPLQNWAQAFPLDAVGLAIRTRQLLALYLALKATVIELLPQERLPSPRPPGITACPFRALPDGCPGVYALCSLLRRIETMRATILIVDDHAQLRALMREIVTEASNLHVVGEAADGAEAMRLIQALRPAIVLLDLTMPGVSGLEVLQWIKMEHPETKVIIVTVHSEDAYRQAAEASGANAFLLKKTLATDLLPAIQRMCGCM